MTQKNESGKGVMVNQTGKPAAKGRNLQNKMAEMQRIAMAVHQLGEDLKTVDCGLEISIGDSQTAMLFSAMLGLEGEGETVTTEVAVAEDHMEETANTPARLEDVAPEEEGPVELDRMTLLRVRMTALRETQKVIFLDEIDPKLFLKDCMAHGHLKRGVLPELVIRFCLGNPGDIFEVAELVDIFAELGIFSKKDFRESAENSFRASVGRVVRKLIACKFLKKVMSGQGQYGPLYRLNPDYDPREEYIRHHFFGKVHPYFHKKAGAKLTKKHKTRYRV